MISLSHDMFLIKQVPFGVFGFVDIAPI